MLWLTVLFAVGVSAETIDGFFTPETDFSDKIMSTNVIDVLEDMGSRMECWMICLADLSCVSMCFNQDSGRCQLHDVLFVSGEDAALENGTAYFSITAGSCPAGYVHVRNLNLCYRMGLQKLTYDVIVSECASRGEHLIVIDSAEKQDHFVKQVTASSGASAISYFIDGSDEAVEGEWHFHDGRNMTFFDFRNGYPSLNDPLKNILVASNSGGQFQWRDGRVSEKKYYICERDINP